MAMRSLLSAPRGPVSGSRALPHAPDSLQTGDRRDGLMAAVSPARR